MTDKPTELTFIGVHVPDDLAEDFKAFAKANERSVAAELRLAMRGHLAAAKEQAA